MDEHGTSEAAPGSAPPNRLQVPPPGPASGPTQTNTKAVLAMVFGIMGIIFIPVLGSIAAVVLGAMARREIAADPAQQGDGMAVAGLVMGWVMIGLAVLAAALVLLVLLVALVVFVILLLVHLASDQPDDDQPGFPWPTVPMAQGSPVQQASP